MDQTWINGRPIGAVPEKTPTDSAPVIEPGPGRTGYGGQYKLVFLKPAERQTVSFTLGELKKK